MFDAILDIVDGALAFWSRVFQLTLMQPIRWLVLLIVKAVAYSFPIGFTLLILYPFYKLYTQ